MAGWPPPWRPPDLAAACPALPVVPAHGLLPPPNNWGRLHAYMCCCCRSLPACVGSLPVRVRSLLCLRQDVRSLLCLRQEPALPASGACVLAAVLFHRFHKQEGPGRLCEAASPAPFRPTAPGPPPPPCRGLLCGGDPAGCPPPGGSSGRNPREVSGAGIGGQPQGLVVLGGASEPTVQGLSQGECVRLLTRKHTSTWPQTGSGGPICPPSLTYPVSLVSPPCCDFLCPVIAQLP